MKRCSLGGPPRAPRENPGWAVQPKALAGHERAVAHRMSFDGLAQPVARHRVEQVRRRNRQVGEDVGNRATDREGDGRILFGDSREPGGAHGTIARGLERPADVARGGRAIVPAHASDQGAHQRPRFSLPRQVGPRHPRALRSALVPRPYLARVVGPGPGGPAVAGAPPGPRRAVARRRADHRRATCAGRSRPRAIRSWGILEPPSSRGSSGWSRPTTRPSPSGSGRPSRGSPTSSPTWRLRRRTCSTRRRAIGCARPHGRASGGQRPVPLRGPRGQSALGVRRQPGLPAALGGPPRLAALIVVRVDEPATKLAALTAGELDFAGIQPAHAAFVAREPDLAVLSYPLLLTYGIALNTRRRRSIARRPAAGWMWRPDRREIVEGYLYGYGTPARSPVPPDVPGYVPVSADRGCADRGPPAPVRAAHRRERRGAPRTDGAGAAAQHPGSRSRSASSSSRHSWRGCTGRRTISTRPCWG